jgi:hypothetical protein
MKSTVRKTFTRICKMRVLHPNKLIVMKRIQLINTYTLNYMHEGFAFVGRMANSFSHFDWVCLNILTATLKRGGGGGSVM